MACAREPAGVGGKRRREPERLAIILQLGGNPNRKIGGGCDLFTCTMTLFVLAERGAWREMKPL